MMNATIILCHPMENSFNHKIANTVKDKLIKTGYRVFFTDLYKEHFNPVLSSNELLSKFTFDEQVQRYMEELSSSDLIVIVHPDWWGQPPAMLKGWIDRVLRPGIAYEYDGDEYGIKKLVPLLANKKARVFITTDTKPENDTGILNSLWTNSIFKFCGITDVSVQIHYNTRGTGELDRQLWIDNILYFF